MSRENLEAASILAPRGEVSRPSKIPLLITAVFCLVVAALVFGAWIR
jgi:high-affinity Fe2+/Pb2+ permease